MQILIPHIMNAFIIQDVLFEKDLAFESSKGARLIILVVHTVYGAFFALI